MISMASNAAKQIPLEELQVSQPQVKSTPERAPRQVPMPDKVGWSKFEKALVTVCGVMLTFMMISLVSTKIAVTNAQHKLQNVNTQITKVNSQNTSSKQVIGELTSQQHLEQVAQKYGLTISNSNIRNVNK